MRYTQLLCIAVLLLSACGAPQSAQPSAQATTPPTIAESTVAEPTTAPPTAAPPTEAAARSTSAPAPTAAQPTALSEPTAEPTARLILPAATSAPGQTAQPSAVPSADAPPPNSTAAPRATATAAPEPAAAPAETAPSQPVRLEIPEIGVDGRLASVGLDANRVPIVPKHDIAWYNLSAQPGAGENIVLWGHVLRFRETPNTPAPFARLKELKPGAEVLLYDKGGGVHRYTVTQQLWVKPDQVEYILPRGKEMVTMVSCIGDKVITGGEVVDMSNRLITIAEPAT
jgi:LPXTG-site transpeptidase (sortase) family protein